MKFYLPIFLYHHVVVDSSSSDLRPFIIDEKDFIWQLDLLEDLGYEPITLNQVSFIKDFSKKFIITFDDCPVNLLEHALPHLERKKWKAVFFALAGYMGKYNEWNVKKGKTRMELMNEADIKHLSSLDHEIGAHAVNHLHLHTLPKQEAVYEITESKHQLEAILGHAVTSFAYPYGHYPAGYKMMMKEAGYTAAVSMYSKAVSVLEDIYCIRRTVIGPDDTAKSIKRKLSFSYHLQRVLFDRYVLKREGVS